MDDTLLRRALKQHGVITRVQAMKDGATRRMIERRLADRRLVRMYSGVYRVVDFPRTWRQSLLAACLAWGPGSAASHRATAAILGLPGAAEGILELTAPRGRSRKTPGVIVHQPIIQPRKVDVVTIDGIPVTVPARTIVDLTTVVAEEIVEESLDFVLQRKMVSMDRLWRQLRLAEEANHRGARIPRPLLEERRDRRIPESPMETRALRILMSAGIKVQRQYRILDSDGRLLARVDLAIPEARIVLEVDGYGPHAGKSAFRRDRRRDVKLKTIGWDVIRITDQDVEDGLKHIIPLIQMLMARAGA